jgi:hypothetical protein
MRGWGGWVSVCLCLCMCVCLCDVGVCMCVCLCMCDVGVCVCVCVCVSVCARNSTPCSTRTINAFGLAVNASFSTKHLISFLKRVIVTLRRFFLQ